MNIKDTDFKYVLQDFSNVYIGARLTYAEAADAEDTPAKVKSALYRLIYEKLVASDETIEHHLRRIDEKELACLFYSQLKIHIKTVTKEKTIDKKGREKEKYTACDYSIKQFLSQPALKEKTVTIQEISFSKINLGTLSI